MSNIDTNTGIWTVNTGPSSPIHNAPTLHKVDTGVRESLLHFLENQSEIVDFGCGNADYAKALIASGKKVDCFDGNPFTPEMTGGLAKVLDLSQPFDLERKYECVISLEVGEHIPKEREQIFLDNLDRHCSQCIILSWAIPGQGGDGHFNEQSNEYVIGEMQKRGYSYWEEASLYFRDNVKLWWFEKTIMIFLKD